MAKTISGRKSAWKARLAGARRSIARRGAEWWASKSPAQKKAYLAKHPNSIYGKKGKAILQKKAKAGDKMARTILRTRKTTKLRKRSRK